MNARLFFLKVRRKIKNLLLKLYGKVLAKRCYKKLLAYKKPDEIILLLSMDHIGDNVYGLAYLDALRAARPGKSITVVVGGGLDKQFFASYGSKIDRLIVLEKPHDKFAMSSFFYCYELSEEALENDIIKAMPTAFTACKQAANRDALYQLRTHVFKLDEASITFHGLPRHYTGDAIEDFAALKNRIAIVNPYAVAAYFGSMQLYNRIAEILQAKGFIVYTNTVGSQKPLPNTRALRCSVADLFAIACEIPLIVSIRTGILDLCITANTNMFVIYENYKKPFKDTFHLTSWPTDSNIREVYLGLKSDHSQADAINEFTAFLNEIEPGIR